MIYFNPPLVLNKIQMKVVSYLDYHRKRFNFLTVIVFDIIKPGSLLEVAPCEHTFNLRFNTIAYTLGYKSSLCDLDNPFRHIHYDLMDIPKKYTWPVVERQFDLVLAAEVIEHLPVNMELVLRFLARYVKPGGRLLIQTPNAVALKKRMVMLAGKNPFEQIRKPGFVSLHGHGHIREYTIDELIGYGKANGLSVEKKWCLNYFFYGSLKARLYNAAVKLLPNRFHDGITILYKKPL